MSAPLSQGAAIRLVARRELRERLRDRSFVVSTLITVAILAAVLFLPRLFGGDDTYQVAYAGPRADTMQTVADAAAKQSGITLERTRLEDEAQARTALESGDLDAYITSDKVVVKKDLDTDLGLVLQTAHQQVMTGGQQVKPLAVESVDPVDPAAEQRGQVAFVGAILLYGQILGYCMWVAFGVVEEKSSRVVELILSAVPTKALLAGKILGIGLLGLLQLVIIAAFGLTIGDVTGMLTVDTNLLIPVGYVFAWFVLGYAFYSSVFAATAARVSRQEELQNVIGPLNMLVMVSFFATFYVNSNPDSWVSRLLGVVPPFSALASPVRMARGSAPWWELLLAMGLMIAAIAALITIGGRIYEGAVLRMGAKVSVKDAWRTART
ncbi:ABC transporter permease [Flindersiella endophytica]